MSDVNMSDEGRGSEPDAPDWPALLTEAALEGLLIHEGGRVIRVNGALARMLGRTPDELVGMMGTDLVVPADRPRLMQHITAGAEDPLEGTVLRADGTTFPCEVRGRTVHAGGRTLRVVVVRGIGERLAMEAALRRRERELASLAEHSPDVITRYDREHVVRFMSRAIERATGVPAAAFVGRRLAELGWLPAELVAQWEAISERVFATGTAEETEFDFPGPDGVRRHYHTRVVPELGEGGRVEHVLTTTRDVSALKHAEQAARGAYATLRGLIHQSITGVYVVQDGRFAYVNERFAEIAGYDQPADVLALPDVGALVHPDDRAMVAEQIRRRLAGELLASHYAVRGVRRDGRLVHLEVHGSAAEYEGRPAIVGTLLDVTERLQLEEQLRQTQKMEAVGRLAGGVAHDFNNILAAILGFAEVVADDLAPDDPRRADVGEIVRAAQRGAGVTRRLLAFSRQQALETEVLDLALVVRELGLMLGQLLPAAVTLKLPGAEVAAPVRATRAQLEQIVVNLALNARDAMPAGGALTLGVRTVAGPTGERAVLEVRDTGHGMSADVRIRAFEPFFTTKPPGQGTGLGLATVYGLVRQFGAEIDLASAPGAGTTARVSFPLAAPDPAAGGSPPAAAGTAERRRILLVEDDAAIRQVTRRVLERTGYTVLEAPDGAAAVVVLRGGEPVDLVLTDGAMPEMGGVALAREAAALRPGLPVLLMSGHAELAGIAVGPDGSVVGVPGVVGGIEKPFSGDHLLALVARTFSGSGSPAPPPAPSAEHEPASATPRAP